MFSKVAESYFELHLTAETSLSVEQTPLVVEAVELGYPEILQTEARMEASQGYADLGMET